MSNPTPILNNINAFDATKGTTISFNIIGGTDIVRSNIVYIYDLSTNDLICTHLYISTESIHELPPNTDSSIVYVSGKSSADFVNNKNYYLQIQTFTNTAGTAGGSGMSVAKTFWCLFNPALSVNAIPAAISTTSYNVGATYTTNITDVTIPVTNIIQQYKFDLYTATGTLVQTSGNIIGGGEQEGTSTTYNITYNFSGLVVNNSYYVIITTTSTEGMTVSAQSNTFTVSVETPTVGGAIVNNNACDGYISVVSNLSDEYGGHVSGEMASFETDSVNNVSSLKVDMEPIQDLHGYDHPWVGGAGSNKWDEVWELGWISSTGDNRDSSEIIRSKNYIPVTPNTTYCIVVPASTDIVYFDDNKVAIGNTDKNGLGDTDRTANTRTTHDNCHYIRFWTRNQTTYNHDIAINYSSTVTTYSPYENLCPISGHDEVGVEHTGFNVWDEEWELGGIGTDGIPTTNNDRIRSKNYVPIVSNTSYYFKAPSNNWRVFFYDADKNFIEYIGTYSGSRVITIPNNARYLKFWIVQTTYNNDISINYPSTDHDYHAYNGTTYHQDIEVTYTSTVQENTPYLFKRTGDVGGDRESIELVGGTVGWNQLLEPLARSSANGITETFDSQSGAITLSGTATKDWVSLKSIDPIPIGHVAICITNIIANPNNLSFRVDVFNGVFASVSGTGSNLTRIGRILQNSRTSYTVGVNGFNSGDVTDGTKLYANIIDLTALFNPTIADYIYSLEQSQAGAGVAWFRQYFPKDYYPYDSGTLRSVEGVSAHETVGFNQWDEEWEVGSIGTSNGQNTNSSTLIRSKNYVPVIPNMTYFVKAPASSGGNLFYYDADKNYLSYVGLAVNTNYTIPSNARYVRFRMGIAYGTTYNHDICINLSDPTRNGEYEPYQKHSYPLDSSLTLRGIPKLDANNNLYYDGDTYESDGTVTRKRKQLLIDGNTASISGAWGATSVGYAVYKVVSDIEKQDSTRRDRIISDKFVVSEGDYRNMPLYTFGGESGASTTVTFILPSTVTSVAEANAWFASNPTTIEYPVATPTTETAKPFTNPQVVDNRGTEAYITTGIVPVGHDTTYLTRDIFGGTLDLVTGVLTVDRVMVDLGTLTWIYGDGLFHAQVPNFAAPSSYIERKEGFISSVYSADTQISISAGAMTDGTALRLGGQIYIKDTSYTDATAFKTAMDGVQLCYELATPQTYQLTPHQIQTLVGQNNVWSDAGDVEVTFNLPITNLLVKRQDTSDTSGKWLTLYSQPITQASDMDFTFIDFLNQHGKTYRYALVPLLTQQQGDIDVEIEGGYTVSDDVLSVFDGVFIANSNGSQKLKAATEYGDLETNQDVGVLTTIGGKYPFVVSNSNLNYHSGSISALIVPSDFYTNGDLDRLDIVERREAIEQFLTDKTAKILKDWNGNIWLITFVENVEVSFVDDYGMGLGTLSAKWVEIGDVNDQTDLKQTGLI